MRVGLFDSGIGGLTVLKKLVSKYPNCEYVYFGDTENMPYGNKTKEELEELSTNIINFLISNKVDIIIIACGTVSSNLGSILKEKYSIPIIDIITPTIKYINNSDYNKIGVLATNSTVSSKVFSGKLNKDVKEISCPEFVPLIENNKEKELNKYISTYVENLKDRDLIILGCTHYPIIKDKINQYLNDKIKLLDMSDCLTITPENLVQIKIDLYFSKIDNVLLNNINKILNLENCSIKETKLKKQL